MDSRDPSDPTVEGNRSRYKSYSRPSSEDNKTTTFATLLPDAILSHLPTPGKERRRIECVLLLGDVSGFTSLTEKYTLTGKGGTYRMTKTLNTYIGKMVEEIMNYGGDILKFSGDAFLCCWRCTCDDRMEFTVNQVLRCALYIQQTMGKYETDVQISLRVKFAISAGTCTFAVVGTEKYRHFVLVGDPIPEVRLTEHLCVSGDVVVSPSAWKFCDPERYLYTAKGNLGHVKVLSLTKEWQSTIKKPETGGTSEFTTRHDWGSLVYNIALDENSSSLRPFIIAPVLKQVDHDQPLEYLTEMRQIVTMFVNVLSSPVSVDHHISLIDDVYCLICKFTNESSGCINEVSLFDKDLMFVVLFGLRGFMHDMEIKSALWCATNIKKSVSGIKCVETVSIGISTGVTYCGVVGHPLRREYTVIGSPVNKAARLMVAYPGKITCERNTFLHSKLPATLFRLQEIKALKGLTSVGPIYEYLEKEDKERNTYRGPKYPILGREQDIHIFLSKLAALRGEQMRITREKEKDISEPSRFHHSGITFHGEPRIGKTRLLVELCDQSKSRGLQCHIISLTSEHLRSPFSSVAYLFQELLGLDEFSTVQDKEGVMLSHFGKHLHTYELCYFNDILQLNFAVSDNYASESSHERMVTRQDVVCKALTSYCSSVAPIYVIGVDDMHNMDPASTFLFTAFLDCDGIMLIVTTSGQVTYSKPFNKNSISIEGIDFLDVATAEVALNYFNQHHRLLHYSLSGLPLDCMAALACQLLEVRGIPLDLETVLQNESQGNPGWVESFLLSLMQAEALLITTLNRKKSYFENLTFPEERLVTCQEPDDLSELSLNDLEVEDPKEFSDMEVKIAAKGREKFSYKPHRQWTLDEKDSEKMALVVNQRVCILGPNYKVDDASIPKTMYGVVMTAFDRLDPFAQLLVKIAAVLGNTCMRIMLVAVMDYPGSTMFAEAVRDIFDAQILCCGTPHAEPASKTSIIPGKRVESRFESFIPLCYCDEGYRLNLGISLPKYAFCSFLKFQTPLHRDTAYGLLTDDQKKDFHGRAVKYLEGEAHKCSVCGGGAFFKVPSLSAPLSEWLSAYERHNMLPHHGSSSENENLILTDVERIVRKEHADSPGFEFNKLIAQSDRERDRMSKDRAESISVQSDDYFDIGDTLINCYGFGRESKKGVALQRCDSDVSMGVCLSKVDLRYCECHLTLSKVFVHLIEHARAAGLKKMLVPLLIEFGAAAVPLKISTQAAKYLSEADELLQELKEGEKRVECYWFALGKVRALQSQALWDLGQPEEALKLLLSALKSYGHPLPTSGLKMNLVLLKESFNLWLFHHAPFNFHKGSHGSRGLSTALAECLSLIFKISVVQNDWHLAELAAVKGFNEAAKTKQNFFALGKAYCDCMEFSIQNYDIRQCSYIESLARKLCRQISGRVTYDRSQLQVLARLYCTTFNARLIRGELESATRTGFRAIRICNKIQQSASLRLQILPLLIQCLILRNRLPETVDLLQELAHTADEESDTSGTTWYYALCLDLLLSSGFTLEKYVTCKAYADEKMDAMSTESVRDPDSVRYIIICLWLWCVRCERWEEALALEDQGGFSHGISSVTAVITSLGLEEATSSRNTLLPSFPNLSVALKYLEGLQLILVGKLDMRAFSAVPDIHRRIKHVTAVIKKHSHHSVVIKPRLNHLIAHFHIIRAKTANAMWLLREAVIWSEKQGNVLEEAWLDHSKNVWLSIISGATKDFWIDHCHEEPPDWQEEELANWSAVMFSLPVPRNPL